MRAIDTAVRRDDPAQPVIGLDPKRVVAISEALTAILALAGLHASAALVHRYLWHDGLLGRPDVAARINAQLESLTKRTAVSPARSQAQQSVPVVDHLLCFWREPVGQCLQECHDGSLLITRQPEIAGLRVVNIGRHFGRRPAGTANHASKRRAEARRAARQRVACVVEVHHVQQALEIAVVHVAFDERGARPLIDIAQGRHLERADEFRRQRDPFRIA